MLFLLGLLNSLKAISFCEVLFKQKKLSAEGKS